MRGSHTFYMKLKLSRKNIREWFCFIIVTAGLFRYISGTVGEACNRAIIIFGALLFIDILINKKIKYQVYICIFLITIILGLTNYYIIRRMTLLRLIIISVGYFPVALYFVIERKLILRKEWVFLLATGMFWTLYRLIVYGAQVFPHNNRNHITAIIMVLLFIAVYSTESNKKRFPLLIYILVFIWSILSIGRGGIISCGLTLLLIVFKRLFGIGEGETLNQKHLFVILSACIGLIVFTFVFSIYSNTIITKYFSRFVDHSTYNSNYIRSTVMLNYIHMLGNPKNLILGINTLQTSIIHIGQIGGNVLSAYLNSHAEFGFFGLICPLLGASFGVRMMWESNFQEAAIVLFCFFIRSITDDVWSWAFGTILVWTGFIFAIEYIRNKKKEKRFVRHRK